MIHKNYVRTYSYQILAPQEMFHEKDPKKAAAGCFNKIGLDPELYRIGHTKASENITPQEMRPPNFILDECPRPFF